MSTRSKYHGTGGSNKKDKVEANADSKASSQPSAKATAPKSAFSKNSPSVSNVILTLASAGRDSTYDLWIEAFPQVHKARHQLLSNVAYSPDFDLPEYPKAVPSKKLVELRRLQRQKDLGLLNPEPQPPTMPVEPANFASFVAPSDSVPESRSRFSSRGNTRVDDDDFAPSAEVRGEDADENLDEDGNDAIAAFRIQREFYNMQMQQFAIEHAKWFDDQTDFESELRDEEETLKEERKLYVKKRDSLSESAVTFYHDIRATISQGSIAELSKHASFEEIDRQSDISGLLRLARETHSISTSMDRFADIGEAIRIFEHIRQKDHETLYEYWQRFVLLRDKYFRAIDGTGCGHLTDAHMAFKFLISLQKRNVVVHYMTYISNLVKETKDATRWPQSVDLAYENLNNYEVAIPGEKSNKFLDIEASFLAAQKSPKKDPKGTKPQPIAKAAVPNGGKAPVSGSKAGGGGKSAVVPPKLPSRPCNICNEAGSPGQMHWQSECPLVLQTIAEQKNRASDGRGLLVMLSEESEISTDQQVASLLDAVSDQQLSVKESVCLPGYSATDRSNSSSQWVSESVLAAAVTSVLKPTEIIIDNGCSVRNGGIIRESAIASNIRALKKKSTVSGLGQMSMTQVCDVKHLGEAMYFNPDSPVNILSFVFFSARRLISYDQERDRIIVLVVPSVPLIFRVHAATRLYVADLAQWWHEIAMVESAFPGVIMPTVAGNLRLSTNREKLQMAKVDQLVAKSGFAADATIMRAINEGAIDGADVSRSDFAKRIAVFGPNVHRLRGNLTDKKIAPAKVELFPRPVGVSNVQTLLTDLFFVDKLVFILVRAQELRYVMLVHIASKSKAIVGQALARIVGAFKSRNFAIGAIVTDGEPAILALTPELGKAGIQVIPKGGTSVHEAERDIRTVKARARSILDWLPYRLCKLLLVFLILFAGNSLNNFPRDPGHSESPNTLLSGFKPDARKMVAFGSYCLYPPPDLSDVNRSDVRKVRGMDGIVIASPHVVEPAVKVWSLTTQRVVTVPLKKVTLLPIPQSVVNYLNVLADSEALASGNKAYKPSRYNASRQDPLFEYRGNVIGDDQADPEDIDIAGDVDATLGGTHVQEVGDLTDIISAEALVYEEPQTIVSGGTEAVGSDRTSDRPIIARLSDEFVEQLDGSSAQDSHEDLELGGDYSPEPPVINQSVVVDHSDRTISRVIADVQESVPEQSSASVPKHSTDEGRVSEADEVTQSPIAARTSPARAGRRLRSTSPVQADTTEVSTRRSTRGATRQDYSNPQRPGQFAKVERGFFVQEGESSLEYGLLHMTTNKAMRKHKNAALTSMVKEISQLSDKHVFKPADVSVMSKSQFTSAIRSSMFLKEKFFPNGDFEKLKSRLVAGGHMQDRSLYGDDETSSPTVAVTSVFMVAAIAASERRVVATVDIPGAYLNADLGEAEIFMRLNSVEAGILIALDPTFKVGAMRDGSCMVQLSKALYGLIEAALLWHKHISGVLRNLGFTVNPHDHCVFNIQRDGHQLTACLHVDDLLITSCSEANIRFLHNKLIDSYGDLPLHMEPILSYVGMTFDYSSAGRVKITQEKFVADLLEEIPEAAGVAVTPALANLFTVADSTLLNASDEEVFHSVVAKVLYLAKRTRPDLLLLCSYLTTRVQCPTESDNNKLLRGIRYLRGTKDMGLTLGTSTPLEVIAYTDASFAVHPNMVSHTGATVTLGGGPIFARSTKQRLNTKSSTESELVGLSDSATQVIWTRNFIIAQGYDISEAIIKQDNMSTIALANKGRSTSERTRHVDIRYFFVKDRIDSGEIKLEYLPTEQMVADILTKPLQGALFRTLRDSLLNAHIIPIV